MTYTHPQRPPPPPWPHLTDLVSPPIPSDPLIPCAPRPHHTPRQSRDRKVTKEGGRGVALLGKSCKLKGLPFSEFSRWMPCNCSITGSPMRRPSPVTAERHSTLENASLIFSFWVIGCFGAVATGMQLRVILMSAMTGMTALQRLLSFALLNWT